MKTETVKKVQKTENTIFDRKAKNSKNEKILNKSKKIPEVPKKPHLQTTSEN